MASMSLLSTKEYKPTLDEQPEAIVRCFESIAEKIVSGTAQASHGKVALSATIIMGLHTVLHVFRMTLLYTRSLGLAAHHAAKAGVYFSEFVTQISDDGQHYIQLTPKDAVLFSYKKTVYDINSEHRASFVASDSESQLMCRVNAALTLSIRLRCRDLEESIGEGGPEAVAESNRRHRGFGAALSGCSQPDLQAVLDVADMATASGVAAQTARAWILAIVRRARRKGGHPSAARGRKMMAGSLDHLTPAKVAAEIVM